MQEIPKVLILDMDEELISKKTKLLEEDGIAVISSSDVREALEKLEEINPHLIILNTEVPMINGELPLTLFRRLTNVPILVIGHREELVYMLELGADKFVCKPLDNSEFIAEIHSILRRYWNYSGKGKSDDNKVDYVNK